ncbi:NADH-quinone oxidoreductase subunit N [Helicobacter suis]|uniref:NADH-quinone oxidoreductase subunit N n=1 Tax=Helicobacter suis TaxID=104628 RepID=UPI001596B090|nr:NADH-quinone oxidoreductase subunit N [Helicobacter suis]BCD50983.1 NADH-quinone oxidoreductase subunit N [Helicobacter suis]
MNSILSSLSPELDIQALLPMLISVGGGICLLLINAFMRFSRGLNVSLASVFLAFNLVVIYTYNPPIENIGTILNDNFALNGQLLLVLASFLLLLLVQSQERFTEFQTPEFYSLYLFMSAGFELMVSTDHLLLILLGLETASLSMCVLMALNYKNTGIEAAIKYFSMGVLASVFFTMGTALLYFLTGCLDLAGISDGLRSTLFDKAMPLTLPIFLLALACMLGAIGFKVSLVPFHTWMPDIYEGNNPVFAGFISIVPKIAGFVVILRVLYIFAHTSIFDTFAPTSIINIEHLYTFLIALTITIPNAMALLQKDVKRMMAYSSISHTGFALACAFVGSSALFVYWLLFLFTNIGAFAVLWIVSNQDDAKAHTYNYPYERFNGLIQTKPFLALLSAIFLCSLAGIPPFSMFWGKVLILQQVISEHQIFLPIVMMLNSAVGAVYYLRLIVAMFFKEPVKSSAPLSSNANTTLYTLTTTMAFLCVFSIFVLQVYMGSNRV